MYQPILSAILSELNPHRCLADITRYWTFRSTVPGPGLRQASEFLYHRHQENGIQVELLSYPADDETVWLGRHRNPLAWTPRSARLEIAEPEGQAGVLCSYAQEPLALLSNSTPTPPGGVTAPVVVMHSGMNPPDSGRVRAEDYQGVDVAGKIIFTDVWPLLVDEQARQHGVLGIITDSVCPPWLEQHPPMRQAADVPDLTMWGTLNGRRNEVPLWGFSLTPRQGQRLRQVIRESSTPVWLHAEVDADLAEGVSEVVNAVIPGSDLAGEEIWVLSHSSEPGALDDASGCCLSVEIARTLKALIDGGALPPLRRTLRFLNAVELEGYLPYVDSRRADLTQVIAALALDSVGQDFRKGGGRLLLFRSPESNPSFTDGLLSFLCTVVAAEPNQRFTPDPYDPFYWQAGPHFPNNDNFLSEGFFDVPTPMLCNWPDKFYHSNLDTPDKLSANSLGRAGAIAAGYVYLLATAGPRQAAWFAGLAVKDWEGRIGDELTRAVSLNEPAGVLRKLGRHLGCQAVDAVRQVMRLAPGDAALQAVVDPMSAEVWDFACRKSESAANLVEVLSGAVTAPPEEMSLPEGLRLRSGMVVKLLQGKLPDLEQLSPAGQGELTTLRQQHPGIDRAWDWLNGRRSAGQVWERLQFGGALPFEAVLDYLDFLIAERVALRIPILGVAIMI
jgi:aminopeptidase YwaD